MLLTAQSFAQSSLGTVVLSALGLIIAAFITACAKWFYDLVRETKRQSQELLFIKSQMLPNGGSSLKDGITRIEKDLAVQTERLTNHITNCRGETQTKEAD